MRFCLVDQVFKRRKLFRRFSNRVLAYFKTFITSNSVFYTFLTQVRYNDVNCRKSPAKLCPHSELSIFFRVCNVYIVKCAHFPRSHYGFRAWFFSGELGIVRQWGPSPFSILHIALIGPIGALLSSSWFVVLLGRHKKRTRFDTELVHFKLCPNRSHLLYDPLPIIEKVKGTSCTIHILLLVQIFARQASMTA